MKTIYLVDYENVHGSGLDIINNTSEDEVFVFITKNADKLNWSHYKKNMEPIEVPAGNQSLDKHLISYLGYLIAKNGKKKQYCIVSNDKGYDVIIGFWLEKGYKVCRQESKQSEENKHVQNNRSEKKNAERHVDLRNNSKTKQKNNNDNPTEDGKNKKSIDISKCELRPCKLPLLGRVGYLKAKGIEEYEIESMMRLFTRYDNKEIDINGVKDVLFSYSWYRNNIDYALWALKALGYEFEQ